MAERQPENVLSQIKQQGEIVRTLKNEGAEKDKVSIGAFWYIHEFSRGVTVRKADGWHRAWESVTVCISHKKASHELVTCIVIVSVTVTVSVSVVDSATPISNARDSQWR